MPSLTWDGTPIAPWPFELQLAAMLGEPPIVTPDGCYQLRGGVLAHECKRDRDCQTCREATKLGWTCVRVTQHGMDYGQALHDVGRVEWERRQKRGGLFA